MNLNAFSTSRWTWPLSLALGGVALAAVAVQASPLGRLLLLGCVLAAAAVVTARWRNETAEAPRAKVVTRLALSARSHASVIEVDTRSFLVVHGDRYAQIVALDTRPSFAQLKEHLS